MASLYFLVHFQSFLSVHRFLVSKCGRMCMLLPCCFVRSNYCSTMVPGDDIAVSGFLFNEVISLHMFETIIEP